MKYLKYFLNYLFSLVYDIYYFFFGSISKRIVGISYYRKSKLYPDYLKVGGMSEAVKYLAKKYCQGKGVDIGGGKWPIEGVRVIENKVEENAYLIKEKDNSLDFVFSSHTLEHLEKWQEALKEWYRVLKPNGILFLYLPHPSVKMWQKESLKFHKWSPDPITVSDFLEKNLKMKIEKITFLPDGYLSFLIIARK